MSTRRAAPAVATLLVALIGLLGATAVAQDDDAELTVVAADTEGRDVTVTVVAPPELVDIEIDDGTFLVTIDGVQRIPVVEAVTADQLEVVLLVDQSGSMQGAAIDAAKAAAANFVEQMPLGTLFSVVGFGDDVAVVSEFTTDRGATIEAINGLEAGGETALYKGVVTAAAQFDPRSDGSRNIVLLSDGGNTVDESSLGLAQSAVLASEATLFAISLQTDDTNVEELQSMVADSGGSVTGIGNPDAIDALFSGFAETIRNQYRLSFEGSGDGLVEVFVAARQGGQTLASTRIDVNLPPLGVARPTATPLPVVRDSDALEAASPPATITYDADDQTWLKWAAIISLSAAVGIFGFLLLFPAKRRGNPLRDVAPIVARAGSGTARGMRRIPDALTRFAESAISRSGKGRGLTRWLESSGLQMRNSEFVVLTGLFAVIGFFLGLWQGLFFAIVLASLAVLGMVGFVAVLVSKRRSEFADQLNGTLQLMAGSLRTGYSQAQVFDVVAREAEAPTSEEFTRVVVEARLGRDVVESCRDLADRMDNEDFLWVANAMEITGEIGGDLAEVLDNVAATIRARDRIRRQVKALSAEGRISAVILALLPVPMFLWQYLVNREYTLLLFNTSLGRIIAFVGLGSLVVGILWMRRLIRLQF